MRRIEHISHSVFFFFPCGICGVSRVDVALPEQQAVARDGRQRCYETLRFCRQVCAFGELGGIRVVKN